MSPKLTTDFPQDLGNVKLPGSLKSRLDEYLKETHQSKSEAVRLALSLLLKVDLETYIQNWRLSQEEAETNNDGKNHE
jgi:Arc/MetJ-type ribon-helix-helix transcriptional regulator